MYRQTRSSEALCTSNESSKPLRLSPWELARMTIDSAKGFVPNYSWFSMSRVLSFAYVYTRPLRALIRYTPLYTIYIYICIRMYVESQSQGEGQWKGVKRERVTSWSNLHAARSDVSICFFYQGLLSTTTHLLISTNRIRGDDRQSVSVGGSMRINSSLLIWNLR